jgi:hypothetical protein
VHIIEGACDGAIEKQNHAVRDADGDDLSKWRCTEEISVRHLATRQNAKRARSVTEIIG